MIKLNDEQKKFIINNIEFHSPKYSDQDRYGDLRGSWILGRYEYDAFYLKYEPDINYEPKNFVIYINNSKSEIRLTASTVSLDLGINIYNKKEMLKLLTSEKEYSEAHCMTEEIKDWLYY